MLIERYSNTSLTTIVVSGRMWSKTAICWNRLGEIWTGAYGSRPKSSTKSSDLLGTRDSKSSEHRKKTVSKEFKVSSIEVIHPVPQTDFASGFVGWILQQLTCNTPNAVPTTQYYLPTSTLQLSRILARTLTPLGFGGPEMWNSICIMLTEVPGVNHR